MKTKEQGEDHGAKSVLSPEQEVYDALCLAGLVQPNDQEESDTPLPPDLCNSARLFARVAAGRETPTGGATITSGPSSKPPATFFSASLFEHLQQPENEARNDRFTMVRIITLVELVRQAFRDVREASSVDRIIADPDLNCRFVQRCWQLGAQASQYELNWTLFHSRKDGLLTGLPHSSRFGIAREKLDEFSFAAEIAARWIQRQEMQRTQRDVSLDRILCDQRLVCQFDDLARQLAPGHSALEYRWAALTLRKARRRMAAVPKLRAEDFEDLGSTRHISLPNIPRSGGLYRFVCDDATLFVGQTVSLRRQVEIHFECGGVDLVPSWLDEGWQRRVRLLVAPMVGLTASRCAAAKGIQVALLRPALNWIPANVA